MRKSLFGIVVLSALSCLTWASCSNEENPSPEETDISLQAYLDDSVSVQLSLRGTESGDGNLFHCGENIIFHLSIKNQGHRVLQLPAASEFLGDSLFCVYTESGTAIRAPWDHISTAAPFNQPMVLSAADSLVLECAWDYLDHPFVTPPLHSDGTFRPVLSHGKYYSSICLKIDSLHLIHKAVHFTVTGDVNPTSFLPAGELDDVFSMCSGNVQADFRLLTAQGEPSTTFVEGEDIIFDLTLTNIGNTAIRFDDDIFQVLGYDLFRVFSASGQDMGTSWSFGPAAEANPRLKPNGILHYHINRNGLPWDDYTEPLLPKAGTPPLPAGRYFTIAPVHVSQEIQLFCIINFAITQK